MKSMVVSRVIRLATFGAAALSVGSVQAAPAAPEAPLENSSTAAHRISKHHHETASARTKEAKDDKDAKGAKETSDLKSGKLLKVSAVAAATKDASKEATTSPKLSKDGKDAKAEDAHPSRREAEAPIPKPSSTPLPTLAASTTRTLAMPTSTEEAPKSLRERLHDSLKAARLDLDAEHAVEPRHTPAVSVVRASTLPEAAPGPCLRSAIDLVRGEEQEMLSLTKCDGSIAPLAVEGLSVLARTGQAAKPLLPLAELAKAPGDAELSPGIKRLDARLVERLQAMVDHFAAPGATTKVRLVSSSKPPSAGSFHAKGRALDLRIEGVKNDALVAFCRELPDTGCGYYPSYAPGGFVHMDVRNTGSGRVSWIDASKPGEAPAYVAQWPLGKRDAEDGNLTGSSAHLERVLDKELDVLPAPEEHAGRTDLSVERESLRDWTRAVEAKDRNDLDRR